MSVQKGAQADEGVLLRVGLRARRGAVVPCALSECEGQCVGQYGAQVGGCGERLWWEAVGACGSMYKRSIAASRGTWRVGAGPPLRAWAWTATRSWCSEACVVRGRAWARVGVAYPAWARPLL